MAPIDFLGLMLVTLLYLTSSLTLSVSVAIPDGTSSKPLVPSQDSSHIQKPSPLPIGHSIDVIDDKNILKKNVTNTSVMAEGGLIPISTTARHTNNKNISVPGFDTFEEFRTRENVPKERNASPSVVARKGVEEKIKPRKGVDQSSVDSERTNVSFNQTKSFENTKPVVESSTAESIHINNQDETSNIHISTSFTNISSNNNSNHNTNSKVNLTPTNGNISHIVATNNTTSKLPLHVEKHKPKPTVTSVDGAEADEPIRPSRTKSSSSGGPRKLDYIVPIIITIIALPLLGVAAFVLYRRGRDCWDKRHYRRMDFLIDGMYND